MIRRAALLAAVADNLRWCSTVCGSQQVVDDAGIWVTAGAPHPLFPDLVTTRPGVSSTDVLECLADRPRCSVKDSFADLDLESEGFTALFGAQWIGMGPAVSRLSSTRVWSEVTSSAELARWSAAAGLPVSLPAHILTRGRTTVAIAHDDPEPAAGFVATASGGIVGVSNVWGAVPSAVWPDVVAQLCAVFPGSTLVGYEHGADLAAALNAGFEPLGPLRVFSREA